MLKTIKISSPPHNVFVISDLHYGHGKDFILFPRGFKTVEEHDSALIRRWNAVCDAHAQVFHLGDLMIKADEAKFWELMRRLTFGNLFLLTGNHNSGQSAAYKTVMKARFPDSVVAGELLYEVYPLTTCVDGNPQKQVTFLPTLVEVSIGGHRITMCHYPLASHHKMGHGSLGLFGHCHSNLPLTNKDTGQGMRLDMGIESFGGPINLTAIKRHLAGRDLDVRDHHGREEAQ